MWGEEQLVSACALNQLSFQSSLRQTWETIKAGLSKGIFGARFGPIRPWTGLNFDLGLPIIFGPASRPLSPNPSPGGRFPGFDQSGSLLPFTASGLRAINSSANGPRCLKWGYRTNPCDQTRPPAPFSASKHPRGSHHQLFGLITTHQLWQGLG